MTKTIEFYNKEGEVLSGRLELPVDRHPHNFAIFAHCFTCTKNLNTVRTISRALSSHGFGVLRFDFTGLGQSQGEFRETNFSGNISDLIHASEYLTENFKAPALMVGHSLGGAAVIHAARQLVNIKAVATIGAPSSADHVTHLFKRQIDELRSEGEIDVEIGGFEYKIREQFLDDVKRHATDEIATGINSALLVMHSPQDHIVGIKNAEEIYKSARHPKSFISLEGADHLLSNSRDGEYTGHTIAQWAMRYIKTDEEPKLETDHQVLASLDAEDGFTTRLKAGRHNLTADEPIPFGGNDFGPSPYDFISAGLSACTAMTVQMYVRRKGWSLENIEVHTSHKNTHAEDCKECEKKTSKIDLFEREIKLQGELDESQKKKILEIADKCPVHRTLHGEIQVNTQLIDD